MDSNVGLGSCETSNVQACDSTYQPFEMNHEDESAEVCEEKVDDGHSSEEQLKIKAVLNRLKAGIKRIRMEVVQDKLAKNSAKLMKYNCYERMSKIKLSDSRMDVDKNTIFSFKKLYPGDPNMDSATVTPEALASAGKSVAKDLKSMRTTLPRPCQQDVPPHYITWVFTNRNRHMKEGQSVENKKRIYYDRVRKETLIASDSEDELQFGHKHKETVLEFNANEDSIIWMATQKFGVSDALFEALSVIINREREKVKDRYDLIVGDDILVSRLPQMRSASANELQFDEGLCLDSEDSNSCSRHISSDQDSIYLEQACLDLKKDIDLQKVYLELTKKIDQMSLQGKSESETTPWKEIGPDRDPSIMDSCQSESSSKVEDDRGNFKRGKYRDECRNVVTAMNCLRAENHPRPNSKTTRNGTEKLSTGPDDLTTAMSTYDTLFCRECLVFDCELHGNSRPVILPSSTQRPEPSMSEVVSEPCGAHCYLLDSDLKVENLEDTCSRVDRDMTETDQLKSTTRSQSDGQDGYRGAAMNSSETASSILVTSQRWNKYEIDLFSKGLQIFGKSSCLIAQNLLKGCKTCAEVANRIATEESEVAAALQEEDVQRLKVQKKKSSRKLRFTQSSSKLSRKRSGEDICRQYSPCACSPGCGDQCPCRERGTPCEKYCGCPKLCRNRFHGCQCTKSQCNNKFCCPCFAANRECDPDVCRNCCPKSEDLDTTPRGTSIKLERKIQSNCQNMRIQLNQKKSVLLGKSDVAGWGLFLKDPAMTHDYLGEYTGELISHHEAEKRGKIYDLMNLSFLFNLNDLFVIDAYRMGNKFKFANHSSKPNCYVKVVKVAGEHRVVIFAKRKIDAGEELFFDYLYENSLGERCPSWAKSDSQKKVVPEYGSSLISISGQRVLSASPSGSNHILLHDRDGWRQVRDCVPYQKAERLKLGNPSRKVCYKSAPDHLASGETFDFCTM